MGRTNMTEFGYFGVGITSHHGTPANAMTHDVPRFPGGSFSPYSGQSTDHRLALPGLRALCELGTPEVT